MSRPHPQTVQDAQGYLVLAYSTPKRIGQVIPSLKIGHGQYIETPLKVIAEATKEEYVAQCSTYGTTPPREPYSYFYKVIAE